MKPLVLTPNLTVLSAVPTAVPGDVNMSQDGSPLVLHDNNGVNTSMYSNTDTYATMSMATPMQSHHRTMHHVNYLPQAGNAPLSNDYTSMPCNLQVSEHLAHSD